MRLLKLAAMCAVFALAACAPAACTTAGAPSPFIQTLDEKALYTVELAYAGGLAALETAVDTQALKPGDAAKAVELLDQANTGIVLARQAYRAGDSFQASANAKAALDALGALRAIIPGATPT